MALFAHHVLHPQEPLAYQTPPAFITSSHLSSDFAILTSTTLVTVPSPTAISPTATHSSSAALDSLFEKSQSPDRACSDSLNLPNQQAQLSMGRSRARKCSVLFLSAILSYVTLFTIHSHYDHGGNSSEKVEEAHWIASSHSWLDRQACNWFGICGAMHLSKSGWYLKTQKERGQEILHKTSALHTPPEPLSYWTSGNEDPGQWSTDERALREIPSYVYDYTPYVHLFSGEEYWPGDIADHLIHTTPYANYTPIENLENRTVDNLDELNKYGKFAYLQSDDNVEEKPKWLGGRSNIPSALKEKVTSTGPLLAPPNHPLPNVYEEDWWSVGSNAKGPLPTGPKKAQDSRQGETPGPAFRFREGHRNGGRSSAPAVLVVVPKEHGVIDAFWFYFYSFNQGNSVFNVRFGNHVGDWEHSVVRFQNGVPKAVFLSEHNFGEAYSYEAVEKIGKRPVIYSGVGTHAMYATPGVHPYVLPWGLLHDETDRGPLWDPVQNHHAYVYNFTAQELKSSAQTPKAPVSWFNFGGHWGDKFYPLSDPRQYRIAGQYHYVNGPYGPKSKNLGRKKICQGNGDCVIRHWLGNGPKVAGSRPST